MRDLLASYWAILVGLLGLGLLALVYQSTTSASKANTAVTDMTQLAQQMQQAYANASSFTTPSATFLTHIAPRDMVSGTTLTNPWGGAVTVAVATNTSQFTITSAQVPADGCVKLVNSVQALTVAVGATALSATDPASIDTACNTSPPVTLVFTFGH